MLTDTEINLSPTHKTGWYSSQNFCFYFLCLLLITIIHSYSHNLLHDSRFISYNSWWVAFAEIKGDLASISSWHSHSLSAVVTIVIVSDPSTELKQTKNILSFEILFPFILQVNLKNTILILLNCIMNECSKKDKNFSKIFQIKHLQYCMQISSWKSLYFI